MKTTITFLVCIILSLSSCREGKKDKLENSASLHHSQVSKESQLQLIDALEKFNKILIDPDQKALDAITDAKLTYGHSSGLIQNKTEFMDDVLHGDFDFVTITADSKTITYGENIAIVRQDFLAKAENKGEPTNVKIGVLLVWRYNEGHWALIARQAHTLKD